ncbi:MAG: polymerase, archaea type [Thermomicrobiales bacterium]|jgi:DNA polymerase elongation subunit (family B)|nr:polymerase, archaea type [Thermomicrobiales bacterium]
MTDGAPPARLTTDELLYGTDSTPRIVAVEPGGSDRVTVYRRDDIGGIEAFLESFHPWLLATRPQPWAALRSGPRITELHGDHPLRFLVQFSSWQAHGEAVRAARESGERIFNVNSPVEQYLISTGRTMFKGMVYEDLCRLQLDIETTGFDARDPAAQVIVVALKTSRGHEELLVLQNSEEALISRLSERIATLDPDVIEGHNLFNFDLPFLTARAARFGLQLPWGRDGSPLRIGESQRRFKAGPLSLPYMPAYVHGRHIVDTYQQIQRYDTGGHLTSYGLKNSVEALGLTRTDREFVPGDQIRDVWRTDRDRLLRYSLDDVRDVDILGRLAVPTEFYQTQLLPRSFQRVATGGPGGKINDLMLRAYLLHGHSVPLSQPPQDYPGGYAELLEVGSFSPVVKCDVESLYPSIMLADGVTSASDTLGAYLPMLRDLTQRRLQAKTRSREATGEDRAMWEGLQSSFKVLINSFYGYLGFGAGLFNDYAAARRVTLAGQRIIKTTVASLRDSGALPIEVDTDGVYFVPPAHAQREEDESAFIETIAAHLPNGIRLGHDGRYRAMLSLRMKTYGLLTYDGRILMKGSALRSRKMEPCFRQFLQIAARGFMSDDREAVREAYFALGERIRLRKLAIDEFTQWSMLNEATASTQPRLTRLLARLTPQPKAGERLEIYEREDGELALRQQYALDENIPYLLRRLHETAGRFRALFPTEADFAAFFPHLSARTDLEQAKLQEASTQLSLF